jgi:alginate O-acetyltransferase complex protein AlgJ
MLEPRRGGPTDPAHDARLRRGILDTQISRPIAWAMSAAFVLLIAGVPISQIVLEWLADEESSLSALVERAPTRENLRQFEMELEQASYAKDYVQPRMQLALSRWGRVGNKRTLVGRAGWLYYTPGLTHLSGPGFLDPDALARRANAPPASDGAPRIAPDPRPAIFAMQRMLAARGIELIVFPVPDKTALQPEHLHARGSSRVAQNLGWPAFVRELSAQGVTVFDPAPQRLRPGEAPRFLSQDTHWTPAWMERVAGELAKRIARDIDMPPAHSEHVYRAVSQQVERVGDLVDMLKLPDDQTLFIAQSVTIRQVQDETGASWQPDPGADVLLLGDSFSNVFTLDAMGWGEAAGLAPHLALALGRTIDVIAQNDSGAFATRQALARELAAGEDRLRGKRVVIWEFASRELSVGDWKAIAWPARGQPGTEGE